MQTERMTTMTKRRSKNSRFRKGSGLYMCRGCSFLTRETGKGESEVALCRECYDGEPGDDLEKLTVQEFAAKWPKRRVA